MLSHCTEMHSDGHYIQNQVPVCHSFDEQIQSSVHSQRKLLRSFQSKSMCAVHIDFHLWKSTILITIVLLQFLMLHQLVYVCRHVLM